MADLTLLHIDAHPDLYDEFEGQRFSHACPFARIMEQGLVKWLVQPGIRTMNPHQRQQADRFGVEVIPMRDYSPGLSLNLQGPLYISLDLDALDPAFAPGVSHHEPGGFSVRSCLRPAHIVSTRSHYVKLRHGWHATNNSGMRSWRTSRHRLRMKLVPWKSEER